MESNIFELGEGIVVHPTKEKVRLESNQIKKQWFNFLFPYLSHIVLQYSDEKGKINWIQTSQGYLWYEKPYKIKPPNVFVPKNKMNKMYEFAIVKQNLTP